MQAGVTLGHYHWKILEATFSEKICFGICALCVIVQNPLALYFWKISNSKMTELTLILRLNLRSLNWTAWKVSEFGVILVRIFPHLDWIRRHSECGKVRIRRTPHTDSFYAVLVSVMESTFKYGFEVKSFCWLPVFKPFEPGVAFHIENNHLHCKCNIELK